mgnify:FL=1
MEEKIMFSEKKSTPKILIVLVIAVIGGLVGSLFTYVALDKKIENLTGTNSNGTTKSYEISSVENPVVAIAENVGSSIVGVKVNYVSQNMFGSLSEADEEGSGIIYKEDGYIITNYHVIESAINNSTAKVVVTFANSEEEVDAKIIGGDKTTDLAVIKIEKTGLTAAKIGKSSDLKVGELAVAIGNPLGQEFAGSVTVGYVSALNRKITTDGRTYKLIQTDAAINPGNSGGALVNSKGEVIGINTVKIGATEVEGLGFAIPTDDAITIIDELMSKGQIERPLIGISGIDLDSTTAKRNNLQEGIYIAQVASNSPASQAGLQKGDIIIGVDDKETKTMEQLNEYKNTKKIGDKIKLKIVRASKEQEVELTLASDTTVTFNTSTSSNNR